MRAKYAIFGMVVSFALGATALEGLRAQTKAPALGIVEVLVSDKEAYAKEFLPPITKTVSGSGGKFLAVVGKTVPLTGALPAGRRTLTMKTLLLATAVVLFVAAHQAHAKTIENALFTCEGELTKSIDDDGKTYYAVVETWKEEDPVDCQIDEGKALKQILAVCHVGDYCIVASKGERGNGGHNLIEKVFEVQRKPASVLDDLKRDSKQ
jgi:uncharacterized protein (DUF1330 family)